MLAGDEDHKRTYPQLVRSSPHKLFTSVTDSAEPDQLLESAHVLDISSKSDVKAHFVTTSIAMGLS